MLNNSHDFKRGAFFPFDFPHLQDGETNAGLRLVEARPIIIDLGALSCLDCRYNMFFLD